ncbi:acyl-coenzyme A thioesterase 8 isoform X1 [Melopsittacus undulatus]|uniref:acyl-coenzyme A thioesterase 8 isoform X1 n=1 Tax=Melopsittacus undulatus TaxID=13146 RepID=UPI00146B0ED0|nr:acyl-coenzyme A thioesterase 8 isoform X1 [Melopsittacus undulatus]
MVSAVPVEDAMAAPGDTNGAGAGSRPGSGRPPPGDLRSALITSVLSLERLELDLFRGRHHWVPATQRLFGGQIVGQALVAAARSVSRDEQVHSLHCYFVRAGDPKVPVLYEVERTRTGKSFSVRSVKAIQHGKPIFTCQASFQLSQESPVQHQFTMPSVPPPEDLLTQEELIQKFLQNPNLAERYRKHLTKIQAEDVPIDIKPVNPPDTFCLEPQEPKQFFWVRARGYIGETDMKVHCCVAAYISDYAFLGTALLPHRQYHIKLMVSLDHSMWFHAPFRADHWMLYECESPWAGECSGCPWGPAHPRSCGLRVPLCRWVPGPGAGPAVAQGRGPGCHLRTGGSHQGAGNAKPEQAVADEPHRAGRGHIGVLGTKADAAEQDPGGRKEP